MACETEADMSRKKCLVAIAVVAILGGVGWWQRGLVLAPYYVNKLCEAGDADRESWVTAVVGLGDAAVPRLVAVRQRPERSVCDNAGCALNALARTWSPGDERSLKLLKQVADRYASFGSAGKNVALQLAAHLL